MFVAIEERRGELSMEISRESLFRKGLFYSGRWNLAEKLIFFPLGTKKTRVNSRTSEMSSGVEVSPCLGKPQRSRARTMLLPRLDSLKGLH